MTFIGTSTTFGSDMARVSGHHNSAPFEITRSTIAHLLAGYICFCSWPADASGLDDFWPGEGPRPAPII